MRSLLLIRLSRHRLRKPSAIVVRHLVGARYLSGTPLCHIVGAEHCGSNSRDGDVGNLVIRNFNASARGTKVIDKARMEFYAPGCRKEVLEKKVPMELMTETGTIGASQGWVATLKDGVVCLQDDLNPSASDSDPKRISLPPLVTLPHCQTELVTNVAMSSSSLEDDDCIVAVKFVGPQLSLCRPAQKKSEWVNIRITDGGFFSSRVMYSKKDKMFSMLASGGIHMGSWDLEKHKSQNLKFSSYAKFEEWEWMRLAPCGRSEHLVESPTGQTYMVKWYIGSYSKDGWAFTERLSVYEINEKGGVNYTKDIGDLCIFLSHKGEPFCLQASLYDISPNFIYYLCSHDFGNVNLCDDTRSKFVYRFAKYPAPYFIPPQS